MHATSNRPLAPGPTDARLAVGIATVHRPDDVGRAVASVREAGPEAIEIHIVDQGAHPATRDVLTPHLADPRVRLHEQRRLGLAAALNRACEAARSEFVAFTGDDCVVRPDWLLEMTRAFALEPRIAVVFGSVTPAAYSGSDGFVPGCVPQAELVARTLQDLAHVSGTTACMGVRRSAWAELGGFDEALGIGAPLRSGEDLDLALRALLAGFRVVQTPCVEVEHRTPTLWRDRAATIRRNWFGSGAAWAKGFKLAPVQSGVVLSRLAGRWRRGGSRVAATYGPRPDRTAMLTGFAAGWLVGLLWPVDRRRGRFRRRSAPAAGR